MMHDSEVNVHPEDTARHEIIPNRSMALEGNELELESASKEGTSLVVNSQNDPLLWPAWRKWTIVTLISLSVSLDVFATLAIMPAAPAVLESYGMSNDLYLVLLISIWELGEGVGGLLFAPCSELFGRFWIYHCGNLCFTLFLIGCAFSPNISSFLTFRFLCGLSSTALFVGPAIIGDIFPEGQRARALAVDNFIVLPFAALAPTYGGFVAQTDDWRASVWSIAVMSAVLTAAALPLLRETYRPLLQKRSPREASLKPEWLHIVQAFSRPLRMLIFYPSTTIVTICTAVIYGASYLVNTILSLIMEQQYGFTEGEAGLCFIAATIGSVIIQFGYGAVADRTARAFAKGGLTCPGPRLPPLMLSCILFAGGMILFGWTVRFHNPWITPLLGFGLLHMGNSLSLVAAENFFVELYGEHSASALGAGVALRAFSGAFLPLAAGPLYNRLGYGWGNTLLGLLCLLPLPLLTTLILVPSISSRPGSASR